MSQEVSPIESLLMWTVRKSDIKLPFIGKEALTTLKESKARNTRRVGFRLLGAGVARHGMKIFSEDGNEIGEVTSGTHTQASKAIGMAYVNLKFKNPDTKIFIDIRGKKIEGVISKVPFVPSGYYRGA